MPRLNANIFFMFKEYPLLDRYDAAARAGFKAVELQFPYTEEVDALKERLEHNELRQIIINVLVRDPDTGLDNVSIRPDRRDLYEERLADAVRYASALGCIGVNTGIGERPDGFEDDDIWQTMVFNQRLAAEQLDRVGIKALVEAINTRDKPGFYVHDTKTACKLIEDVGHPNIGLLYDIYHMQVMEGNLAETMEANLDRIWHMQLGDNPGRHEPGTGEINYDFLLSYIDSIGYKGWIGCEYIPAGRTEDGLGWIKRWQ